MAKFSLPALDFTIQSPLKIKKKQFEAYKDPKAEDTIKTTRNEMDISISTEEPETVSDGIVGEIGARAGKTIVGAYAQARKEILDEQLRKLGHVRRFTVRQVIPALVQLFETKHNRSFKKMELMAMEGYVHGIGNGTLGTALNQGPFEPNKIQMKNGQWRNQRNNASWRIEMSHWNAKGRRFECNLPLDECIKCEAITEFYNAK